MSRIVSNIVEVCVFKIENKKPKFLILRRSKIEKLFPNSWQIISGKIHKKEKAMETAIRELKEETGLAPEKFWVTPHANLFLFPIIDEIHATSVFSVLVKSSDKIRLSEEHYQYKWCTIIEANKKLVWPGQIKAIEITNEFILKRKESARFAEISENIYKKTKRKN